MTLAIMQPYFFPYIGYFQLINSSDKFLLLDDVAYINKGWINRNRILINGEAQFFVMPVVGASQNKTINSLHLLEEDKWRSKLLRTMEIVYKNGTGYVEFFPVVKEILSFNSNRLSDFIANSIKTMCSFLEIKTTIVSSTSAFNNEDLKAQNRIIDLCLKENAKTYINASGGRSLYRKDGFESAGIKLQFLNSELLPYQQIGSKEFVPGLSIIDMLMNNPKQFVQEQLNNFKLD